MRHRFVFVLGLGMLVGAAPPSLWAYGWPAPYQGPAQINFFQQAAQLQRQQQLAQMAMMYQYQQRLLAQQLAARQYAQGPQQPVARSATPSGGRAPGSFGGGGASSACLVSQPTVQLPGVVPGGLAQPSSPRGGVASARPIPQHLQKPAHLRPGVPQPAATSGSVGGPGTPRGGEIISPAKPVLQQPQKPAQSRPAVPQPPPKKAPTPAPAPSGGSSGGSSTIYTFEDIYIPG